MSITKRGRGPRALAIAAGLAAALPASAGAQTWEGARTTPDILELAVIDATGETGWLWGEEDVAGDGLAEFKQPEQSVDIRTAYVTTDASRLWLRAYVSDPNNAGGNVSVFVFIDADGLPATGGPAASADIDPALAEDPSPGGYEYAFGVRGNESVAGVWTWNDGPGTWGLEGNLPAIQTAAEAGTDTDPILVNGDAHGYVQGVVNLSVVGLTEACAANLYVRSVDGSAQGASDLDVGSNVVCVGNDANADGVPDPLLPTEACTTDDQCPFFGVCIEGACLFADACNDEVLCPDDETCRDGRCVIDGGAPCEDESDCDGLLCVEGACASCVTGTDACGAGRTCAPDGRCLDGGSGSGAGGGGLGLDPGDAVQGGACACSTPGGGAGGATAWLALTALALAASRRLSRKSR